LIQREAFFFSCTFDTDTDFVYALLIRRGNISGQIFKVVHIDMGFFIILHFFSP